MPAMSGTEDQQKQQSTQLPSYEETVQEVDVLQRQLAFAQRRKRAYEVEKNLKASRDHLQRLENHVAHLKTQVIQVEAQLVEARARVKTLTKEANWLHGQHAPSPTAAQGPRPPLQQLHPTEAALIPGSFLSQPQQMLQPQAAYQQKYSLQSTTNMPSRLSSPRPTESASTSYGGLERSRPARSPYDEAAMRVDYMYNPRNSHIQTFIERDAMRVQFRARSMGEEQRGTLTTPPAEHGRGPSTQHQCDSEPQRSGTPPTIYFSNARTSTAANTVPAAATDEKSMSEHGQRGSTPKEIEVVDLNSRDGEGEEEGKEEEAFEEEKTGGAEIVPFKTSQLQVVVPQKRAKSESEESEIPIDPSRRVRRR